MTTKTYIGFALFIALFAIQAQATPIMGNLTTGTDLFVDDFEGVTANPDDYVAGGATYNPVASTGAWILDEDNGGGAQIAVTSYATPGAAYNGQYLRLVRDGFAAAYGDIADQSTVGDALRFEIGINLKFGSEIRILGDSGGSMFYNSDDFIRLSFSSTLIRYQDSAGAIVDSGITNYAKDQWGVLTIDYVVGSDEYTLGYEGQTANITGLAPTIGIPTSVDGFVLMSAANSVGYYDSIPEPATLGLFAIFGGAALFIRKKFMI